MDRRKVSDALGRSAGGTLRITSLQLEGWGQNHVFDCVYTVDSASVDFQLVFKDCRETRWRIYAHGSPDAAMTLPETEVVNFALGQGQHRKAAQMLTTHFGLSLYYGEALVETETKRTIL